MSQSALGDDGIHRRLLAQRTAEPLTDVAEMRSVASAAASQRQALGEASRVGAEPLDQHRIAGELHHASASAATSPWGTSRPVTPSAHRIAKPRAVRGQRRRAGSAAASTIVMPHPSLGDGNTFAVAERSSAKLLVLGDEAVELDGIDEPKACREPLQLRLKVAPAGDVQASIGTPEPRLGQCPQRQVHSFVTLEPSDIQEGWGRGAGNGAGPG